MRAETLGLMVKALGIEQVVAAGGSGRARDSIIFTMMSPDPARKLAAWDMVFTVMWSALVRKLAVGSLVGGVYSTMSLAGVYALNELRPLRSRRFEGAPR